MWKRVMRDIGSMWWQLPEHLYGLYRISLLHGPCVTVFGGGHVALSDPGYEQAKELGRLVASKGFSLLTGGGSGVMEAALCGGLLGGGDWRHALGIGVRNVDQNYLPHCRSATIFVNNFNIRKVLLTHYSVGIVVCFGGIGTFDELFYTVNLLKTVQLQKVPLVLLGADFWRGLTDWMVDFPVAQGLIEKSALKIFHVAQDPEEACALLFKHCSKVPC